MPTRKLATPLWATLAFPTVGAALTIIAAVVAAAAARRLQRHHRRGLCRSRSPAGTFTLGYWDIRGLAAPARMMLAYRGAAFEDRMYSLQPQEDGGWGAPAWFDTDRPPLRERNAFINLPYLVDHESGIVVSQSTALYQFLGRKLGLMGENEAERVATEQTLAQSVRPSHQAFDLRNECVRVVYPFAGTSAERFSAALAKHLRAVAAPSAAYDRFSRFLGAKQFFAGSRPTAGDFHIWEMLDQHELMASSAGLPSPLEAHPTLRAFHARLRALPQLQLYFDSEAAHLPCNNRMAHFR